MRELCRATYTLVGHRDKKPVSPLSITLVRYRWHGLMFLDRFHLLSLKTRVFLLTLLVVVVGFFSLTFYTKELLRDELLFYTGEQQRSALNQLTSEVEHGLKVWMGHLSTVASRVSTTLLNDRAALQAYLLE